MQDLPQLKLETPHRAKGAGSLFASSIRLYGQHPALFVLLSILPITAHLLWNIAQDAFTRSHHPGLPEQGALLNASGGFDLYWSTIALSVAGLLVWYLIAGISMGAVTICLQAMRRGKPLSLRSIFAAVRPLWRRLLGLQIATLLYAWGPFLFLFVLANVFAWVVLGSNQPPDYALLVWYSLTLLAFVAGIPFGLWMQIRLALAIPALQLVNLSIHDALQHSVRSTHSRRRSILAVILLIGGLRWLVAVAADPGLNQFLRRHPSIGFAPFPLVSFLLDALFGPLYFLCIAQLALPLEEE